MTTWSPDASKKIALVSDLAAMASSVDDEISGVVSVRQGHTYVWTDAADRTNETGMTPGSTGVQLDTGGIYTHVGGIWKLTGGTLPTFAVRGTGSQNLVTGGTATTISSMWGTPSVNTGFSAWASGVLTVREAGIYLLNGSVAFNANGIGNRYIAIAESGFSSDASTDFYQRIGVENLGAGGDVVAAVTTFASLAAGATIKLAVWHTADVDITTDPSQPGQTQLSVRYLGPA